MSLSRWLLKVGPRNNERTETEADYLREILRLDREVGPAQTTEEGRREITRQIANLAIMAARDAEHRGELTTRSGGDNTG